MQKLIKPVCLLDLILLSFPLANSICYGSDDSLQLRSSAGISWEANKDWRLTYRESLRFNDGGGTLYSRQSNFGLRYKSLAEWLDIGINYSAKNVENDESTDENRTSLSAIMRGKVLGRDVRNRLRIDYRDRDGKSNKWRFRNKLTLNGGFEDPEKQDMRLLKKGLFKPYVADEIFINLDGTGFSQNRVSIGAVTKLNEKTSMNFYYALQTIKNNGGWKNNNLIGINFTYHF